MMIRKSFLIQVKEGMAEEYERRHNNIWPELTALFKQQGVQTFSINLHEPTGFLFGYIEIEDEARFNAIGDYDVCKKWWKYMTEVLVCENENSEKGKEEILREVFYFEKVEGKRYFLLLTPFIIYLTPYATINPAQYLSVWNIF